MRDGAGENGDAVEREGGDEQVEKPEEDHNYLDSEIDSPFQSSLTDSSPLPNAIASTHVSIQSVHAFDLSASSGHTDGYTH